MSRGGDTETSKWDYYSKLYRRQTSFVDLALLSVYFPIWHSVSECACKRVARCYGIDHVKRNSYPQGNGQVEATSKTLIWIFSRMVYEDPKKF